MNDVLTVNFVIEKIQRTDRKRVIQVILIGMKKKKKMKQVKVNLNVRMERIAIEKIQNISMNTVIIRKENRLKHHNELQRNVEVNLMKFSTNFFSKHKNVFIF